MPIYEYRCAKCGTDFELLVSIAAGPAGSTKRVSCPECRSARVRRRLSAFAVRRAGDGGSRSAGRSSCSSCGGGHCSHCH